MYIGYALWVVLLIPLTYVIQSPDNITLARAIAYGTLVYLLWKILVGSFLIKTKKKNGKRK